MNQLFPQGSMVQGKAYLSEVQKWEKAQFEKSCQLFFGPPSTFEVVLDLERIDQKKGALAACSHGKCTLIVQSLH